MARVPSGEGSIAEAAVGPWTAWGIGAGVQGMDCALPAAGEGSVEGCASQHGGQGPVGAAGVP